MAAKHHTASKTLETATTLANLLPTGTVLSLQALLPTLTNNGRCLLAHKYLAGITIGFNAIFCFLSAFTDSYIARDHIYYGFATPSGLRLFGISRYAGEITDVDRMKLKEEHYQLSVRDFFHAALALLVFLCFACSDSKVQDCYFYRAGAEKDAVVTNLPLLASVFASFVFAVWPTKRKGIGVASMSEKTSSTGQDGEASHPTAPGGRD